MQARIAEFGRPGLMFKIQKPPFHTAWATPILHDALAGLRTNGRSEVLDIHGQVIPASTARANRPAASRCMACRESPCSAASQGARPRRART